MTHKSRIITSTFCLLLFYFLSTCGLCWSDDHKNNEVGCFSSVFAFGDSLTDTGNAIHTPNPVYQIAARFPYGETFFHYPTGRCSDGRLVVDFLCEALQNPLLTPYLVEKGANFSEGENFAIAGTTALNTTFLLERTNVTSFTPLSLQDEIEWFKTSKSTSCLKMGDVNVGKVLEESLFYFGEIGGNDYNYWSLANKSVDDISKYIPIMMEQINQSLQDLIDEGAKYIIIQGNLPMGCLPSYLYTRPGNPQDYDELGCLKAYNMLSSYHNAGLKSIIQSHTFKNPDVNMVYFDVEGAFFNILENPHQYGFTNTTGVCFNLASMLNPSHSVNVTDLLNLKACSDPRQYVSWDGIHLTEAMYRALTQLFLSGDFSEPHENFLAYRCQLSFQDF